MNDWLNERLNERTIVRMNVHVNATTRFRERQNSSSCAATFCRIRRSIVSPVRMDLNEVAEMILQGKSHEDISRKHRDRFPGKKEFSKRSVRRFCHTYGIHKPKGLDLDSIVEKSVKEVQYIVWTNWLSSHAHIIFQVGHTKG